MTADPHSSALTESLATLARTSTLLVALDFDGTLAPTVDDPADARALPESQRAIERLHDLPATRIALVSGRALDSLLEVAQPAPTVLLAASHGAEFLLDGEYFSVPVSPERHDAIRRLQDALAPIAGSVAGAWLEQKPVGFALHTRLAPQDDAGRAQSAALDAARAAVPDMTVREGKDVLEFSVAPATKGHAIARLREYSAASGTLFIGDDVTDEDAFRALQTTDVGVKVGDGLTNASYRVNDPTAVAVALGRLAEFRSAHRVIP